MQRLPFADLNVPQVGPGRLRTGLDTVEIRRIRESIDRFGARFVHRLFSDDEVAYARQGTGHCAERLAARFAAKEAAIKAFGLSEAGIGWRDIEVRKLPSGACRLALYGKAAAQAAALGVSDMALSLSHDGEYAAAVVSAWCGSVPADEPFFSTESA